jgi:hypothetical protein
MNNIGDNEDRTYKQAISGQYTNYEGSQYASNLRCTLLDDLKRITLLLSMCIFTHVDVCLRTKWGPYMMEADRHIYSLLRSTFASIISTRKLYIFSQTPHKLKAHYATIYFPTLFKKYVFLNIFRKFLTFLIGK